MKTESIVQLMACERHIPYGARLAAKDEFPEGKSFDYDLRLRLVGRVWKETGSTKEAPPIDSVLCKSVLVAAAEDLGLQPTQLAAAILKAAQAHTVNGKFMGDEALDEDNPFATAIDVVNEQFIPTLKTKKTSPAGSVRAGGKRPSFYANSIIKPS